MVKDLDQYIVLTVRRQKMFSFFFIFIKVTFNVKDPNVCSKCVYRGTANAATSGVGGNLGASMLTYNGEGDSYGQGPRSKLESYQVCQEMCNHHTDQTEPPSRPLRLTFHPQPEMPKWLRSWLTHLRNRKLRQLWPAPVECELRVQRELQYEARGAGGYICTALMGHDDRLCRHPQASSNFGTRLVNPH